MNNKKLIAFDMDGTLCSSRCTTDIELAALLNRLCEKYIVVIITGWDYESMLAQIVEVLPSRVNLSNLYLYPNTGTKKYLYMDGEYHLEYKNDFNSEQVDMINEVFKKAIVDLNLMPKILYGPLTENRGAQITFAWQGQMADISVKEAWDFDQQKRKKIREYILPLLPGFNVNIAGTTSIDITRKWVDKWWAMNNILKEFNLQKKDTLFIGDCIFPGWNDYPVEQAGFETIQIPNFHETKKIIADLLK